jgi:hypothetical protein
VVPSSTEEFTSHKLVMCLVFALKHVRCEQCAFVFAKRDRLDDPAKAMSA